MFIYLLHTFRLVLNLNFSKQGKTEYNQEIILSFDFKVIFCDYEFFEKIYEVTRSLKPVFYTLTNHIENVAKI